MAEQEQGRGRLCVEGAATLRTIDDIHTRLSGLLNRHSAIEIDLSAATEVDLSLVQLLLSARHSAQRAGKAVMLTGQAPGVLQDVLARGGFLGPAAGQEEFWLKDGTTR